MVYQKSLHLMWLVIVLQDIGRNLLRLIIDIMIEKCPNVALWPYKVPATELRQSD